MKYEVHPAANFFPLMSDDELAGLIADIDEHGQREPATLWKGQLIDGRNRAVACERLGRELDCCELDDDTDPVAWVISHNLHRRHLSQSQKAMVGERVEHYYKGLAKERQKEAGKNHGRGKVVENLPPPNSDPGKARDQAGAAVGVSGKLIDAARTVREHGSKELVAKVESGQVSVTKAATVAKSVPKAEQAKAIDQPTPKPERDVFVQLRKAFDAMNREEQERAALLWDSWLDERE